MRWVFVALMALSGCAAAPAVGRGGDVYEVVVFSINGRQTADRGPSAHPAVTIQVGDTVRRAWLAAEPPNKPESPVLMRADAHALQDGILVETGWTTALVHEVTAGELAAGAALVCVPGIPRPTEVELRFNRLPSIALAPSR